MSARPRSIAAASTSRTRTVKPAVAHAWAIPLPMFPPPSTATTAGGCSVDAGMEGLGADEGPVLIIVPRSPRNTVNPERLPGPMEPADPRAVEAALATERQFVLSLGGFALEIPGASLVTHERLPAPRFNFVQELGVGPERQAAFFERALDHYFQRALRPAFRLPEPAPAHLDAGLRRFGFRSRDDPLALMLAAGPVRWNAAPRGDVRPAERSETDLVASFWSSEAERPEFRAALEVAWSHPNPPERLTPLLAFRDGEAVSAALVYRYRSMAGIYFVVTRASARGQGSASDLVRFAVSDSGDGARARYSIFADSPRLQRRLETLGFAVARRFRVYELPEGVELSLPPPGPATGPRWRPPR
jgi:hypothetical protein